MTPFALNIRGSLRQYVCPSVMGILNLTPDSFYSQSRAQGVKEIASRVEQMLSEGADFIDVGAYSTRPGCNDISAEEEIERLRIGLKTLREVSMDIPVSVDTFRAQVARIAVEELGADIINDISGGELDPKMFCTIADLKVPYILMHMRGTPQEMQNHCQYDNVVSEVLQEMAQKVAKLNLLGINDIIIDPGFGFSKTLDQNYELMKNLNLFAEAFKMPVLAGISRKSMIYKLLGSTPEEALPGTDALNFFALQKEASILRVHDVKAAKDIVKVFEKLHS